MSALTEKDNSLNQMLHFSHSVDHVWRKKDSNSVVEASASVGHRRYSVVSAVSKTQPED